MNHYLQWPESVEDLMACGARQEIAGDLKKPLSLNHPERNDQREAGNLECEFDSGAIAARDSLAHRSAA